MAFIRCAWWIGRVGGKLDNMSLWSKALSSNKINLYMDSSPNGDEENLMGLYI